MTKSKKEIKGGKKPWVKLAVERLTTLKHYQLDKIYYCLNTPIIKNLLEILLIMDLALLQDKIQFHDCG